MLLQPVTTRPARLPEPSPSLNPLCRLPPPGRRLTFLRLLIEVLLWMNESW